MNFTTKLREMGNSQAVLIPSVILKALSLSKGDEVEMTVENGVIKITKKL